MSVTESKYTTLAESTCPSCVVTDGSVIPATTCALVITRSGAKTKPEPDWFTPQA